MYRKDATKRERRRKEKKERREKKFEGEVRERECTSVKDGRETRKIHVVICNGSVEKCVESESEIKERN